MDAPSPPRAPAVGGHTSLASNVHWTTGRRAPASCWPVPGQRDLTARHRRRYRADHGPILRCTDPRYDSLPRLWAALDRLTDLDPIAIPHHSANAIMGVDWDLGWNPRYEKAVEVYSVWGSSERSAAQGNPRPIRACNGEVPGRHVQDALRRGYRFGFVGGGDIHDGRPGDDLHARQADVVGYSELYPQGLTACLASELTRNAVFDAIKSRRTYATTLSRIYLHVEPLRQGRCGRLRVRAASEEGLQSLAVVTNDGEAEQPLPEAGARHAEPMIDLGELPPDRFCYLRVTTRCGNTAWSSPVWGTERTRTQALLP